MANFVKSSAFVKQIHFKKFSTAIEQIQGHYGSIYKVQRASKVDQSVAKRPQRHHGLIEPLDELADSNIRLGGGREERDVVSDSMQTTVVLLASKIPRGSLYTAPRLPR